MKLFAQWLGLDPAEYNQWQVHWGGDLSIPVLGLIGLLIPLALWFFGTSLSRIQSRIKRVGLFGLRVAAFALLLMMFLQPQMEFRKSQASRNSVAVLLDNSRSLSIKTFPSEATRGDRVRQALADQASYFEKLQKDFQVDFFLVSDHAEPVLPGELDDRYRLQATNTDFTRVFMDVKNRYQGKSLQGVVLFSDGADLTQGPDDLSPELRASLLALGGRVHTVQAGGNENFKDLAIENISTADFGFVHQPVNLSVTVHASNIGNKNVSLVLKEGGTILVSKIVEIREGQDRYAVDMEFTPTELGRRVYSLSLPVFAGEAIAANNRRDFQVKVVRDRIRVLHLNGRPSWDSRFLREVLANNPKVDLLSFFILRTLTDDVAAPTSELSLIPFPSNLLFADYLNSFDLIIFQNFRYEPFIDKKYLNNIQTFIQRGGGFLMVGGELSFQMGGYDRTVMEDMLPVSLEGNVLKFLNDPYRVEIPAAFARHPLLKLEKDFTRNRQAWEQLPSLTGLNLGLEPRKDAQILLQGVHQNGEEKETYPLLVTGRNGKGRVAALATDASWDWNFRRVGEGGSGRYYQKFWSNMIAWLTGDPEMETLQIETDKERYREGEEVLVKVRVLYDDYNPDSGKTIQLSFAPPRGELQTVSLITGNEGEATYQFLPAGEGFYRLHMELERDGNKIGREALFGVFADTAEFMKPLVNAHLLKQMAEISGGRYAAIGDGPLDLSMLTFSNPEVLEPSRRKTFSLWDNWWCFGLLVGILSLEWWLRRKAGLS